MICFCLCVLLTIVDSVRYFCIKYCPYFNYLKKTKHTTDWEFVGEVTKIFIYPLDGGPALDVRRALCTSSGLRKNRMIDRTIIAYSTITKEAILNLEKDLILENRDNLFKHLKLAAVKFNQHEQNHIQFNIDYLGDPIQVVPFPMSMSLATILGGLTNEVQLCYFAARKRKAFIRIIIERFRKIQNLIITGFSSNYSNFTMIDANSFQEFRNAIGPNASSLINFTPQLIVSKKIPDNTTTVRIGGKQSKIKFIEIIPCNIVSPMIQKKQSLFGFNMKLKHQTLSCETEEKIGAMVHVGDKVYVKRNISGAL